MRTSVIRRRLLLQRAQLLARYRDELDRVDEELAAREPEDVERATEQWDAQVLSHLGDVDARALAQVIAALRRLDDGTYGRCITCGDAIEPTRLEALPAVATCFACADAEDRARHQRAG